MPELLYLKGTVLHLEEGRVSVEDRGFQFGDGVYEVIGVYQGHPYELQAHLDRLFRSAAEIDLSIPYRPEELDALVRRLLQESQLAQPRIYIQVTRGYAPRTHAFPAEATPTIVIYTRNYDSRPSQEYEKGVRTITVPDDRWGHCHIKSIALLPNCLAKERAYRTGAFEAIFYSRKGVVYEGTSTNVFCIIDGAITTAPLSNKILPGITRARLIELARAAGLEVAERDYTVDEMKSAGEVFLTGTTTEVMPVIQVDETTIGRGEPGPLARRLRQLMLEHIRQCCARRAVPASEKP